MSGQEPENTLRAICRAIELGADGIEIDVRMVAGCPVVIHDATVDRTTNGRGPLHAYTLDDLQGLDAGKGERIPTLDDVIALIAGRVILNVELKEPAAVLPVILALERAASAGWSRERFLISSFRTLDLARCVGRGIPLGVLCKRPTQHTLQRARELGAWSVNPALRHVTAGFVERAHAAGFRVFVYTVNTAAELARMHQIGVDGVFSDNPELVIESATR